MRASEQLISPWETVLWRTPAYWRTMLTRARLPGIILAAGIVLELNSADRDFTGLLIWGPLLWMLFVASYPLGAWSEMLLTDRKLVFHRRFRRPAIQIVERDDIAGLEIFEGSLMLVVHGRKGELHRAWVMHDLMPLARAMNVATARWRTLEYPDRLKHAWRWTLIPYLTLVFAGTVMFMMVMPEVLFSTSRSVLPTVLYNFFTLAVLLLAIVPAVVVATVFMDPIRRIFMGREMFALYRRHKYFAALSGDHPSEANEPGFWGAIGKARLAIDRLMNGPLPECPPVEPEQYQPGAFPPPEEDGEEPAPS